MEFIRESKGEHNESIGTMKLYVNGKMVAQGPMRAQVGKFTLVGDGLCVGFDSGDPVSELYKSPGEFKGGVIHFVKVTVGKVNFEDMEKEAQRGLLRD
jgi:arylsulfatase